MGEALLLSFNLRFEWTALPVIPFAFGAAGRKEYVTALAVTAVRGVAPHARRPPFSPLNRWLFRNAGVAVLCELGL